MFTKAIHSQYAPKAIGPYSPAVKLGDFVYVSGQLPIEQETDELIEGGIQEQTYQCLKNMEAVLAEMNLEMRHVVKTTVYMSDLSQFAAMNEIYATYFADPYPARSTVEVKALPKGAMVEIEAIVIDTLVYEAQANQHHHHHHDHDHDHNHDHGESCSCGGNCSCGHNHNDEEEETEGCTGSFCG